MRSWAAFSSSDINNNNILNTKEIKMMLWVYEEDEPTNYHAENILHLIDKDDTGDITRKEWL